MYAHNILIDTNRETNLPALLCDYGAATFYDKHEGDMELIEVRAWGILADELLALRTDRNEESSSKTCAALIRLQNLASKCQMPSPRERPTFSTIIEIISESCSLHAPTEKSHDARHGIDSRFLIIARYISNPYNDISHPTSHYSILLH